MKKILIVIPSLEQGGGQKFVMDLANGIDKTRFQVKVLVYYACSDSIFDRFAKEHGIDTVYLNKTPGLQISFFEKVRAVVREYAPDVIHTHLDSMLYLLPAYKRKQVKLHTVHTLAEKETNGLQGVVRFLAYKICGVVPVGISDTVADSIAREHKIKRDKVPVVYNGVDCKRYDIPRIKSDKIRFVTVGTIYSVKNYSFLVDCFAEVAREIDNVTLTIVGDGVLRGEIEEQIQKTGVSDKVRVTGVVSDVENYLADADVYVASSIFEGLPISMLEAMSAGLPVISTKVGGVPDIIKDGENGILVASGDKEGYVQALRSLINDPSKLRAYSERAKALSQKYDEKITVEGYERLYQD